MHSLRNHYLFSGLDDAQFQKLREHTEIRKLGTDQALFRQGDTASAFFILMEGAITLYRVSAEGQEKIMRLIQPGQSFAESIMFMDEARYPVHARATRASQVAAVETEACLELMQVSFATCRRILARMTERIQAHWDEIEALSLQNSRYRIVHYLLGLAAPNDQGAVTILLPARKTQIAAQLAVTPETLSRALRALNGNGLIELKGYRVHIPDIAALRGQLT